jgi:Holliday junction resolvase
VNNKKLGNDFEASFCQILADNGFWAHQFAQNQDGQPADVMAAKNGRPFLIDCKVCSGKGFALSRMEDNQDLSMSLWKNCGNGEAWFSLLVGEEIYMMQHTALKACSKTITVLRTEDIKKWGMALADWLEWAQK